MGSFHATCLQLGLMPHEISLTQENLERIIFLTYCHPTKVKEGTLHAARRKGHLTLDELDQTTGICYIAPDPKYVSRPQNRIYYMEPLGLKLYEKKNAERIEAAAADIVKMYPNCTPLDADLVLRGYGLPPAFGRESFREEVQKLYEAKLEAKRTWAMGVAAHRQDKKAAVEKFVAHNQMQLLEEATAEGILLYWKNEAAALKEEALELGDLLMRLATTIAPAHSEGPGPELHGVTTAEAAPSCGAGSSVGR
jgi:hypothetical protein